MKLSTDPRGRHLLHSNAKTASDDVDAVGPKQLQREAVALKQQVERLSRALREGEPAQPPPATAGQRMPKAPSTEEVAEHTLTHRPYQGWCTH